MGANWEFFEEMNEEDLWILNVALFKINLEMTLINFKAFLEHFKSKI